MLINIISGIPLLFSNFALYLNTPYILILLAIVTHTLIYRKLYFSKEYKEEFFTLKSFVIFIVWLFADVAVGMGIVYVFQRFVITPYKDTFYIF